MAQTLAFTKDKNQIATPWHIVEFLYDLLKIRDKAVLDPTAGHGAMLEYAGKKYGIELDEKPYKMICERYPDGEFINGSVFDQAEWMRAKNPDAILMNPPFNADKTKGLEFVRFTADSLNHGKLAAIVPTGAISAGKKAIDEVKKQLLEHNRLEAVLKLNSELFYPEAAAAVVILIFEVRTPHSGSTWFADFEKDGLTKDRTKGRIDKEGKWEEIKQKWLQLYEEKPSQMASTKAPADSIPCILKEITAGDDWTPSNQIKKDPADMMPTHEDFYNTVKAYMTWKINQVGLAAFIRENPHLMPGPREQINHIRKRIMDMQARLDELEQLVGDI